MKIAKLELENVKRVRAVEITPSLNGLTVIGGKNGQGKTSVLDAIAWALGGDKYRPSQAAREGSVLPPKLHIVLDNGIVVDREGKNSALRVTDPTGKKAGQALLDSFVERLALDLPRFLNQSSKDKAATLLRVIGMEKQIKELEDKESSIYNHRHALGQIADQKMKFANEMPDYPDVPEEPVSASELIQQQQAILLKNAENQKKRDLVDELSKRQVWLLEKIASLNDQVARLMESMEESNAELTKVNEDLVIAGKTAEELVDESTADIEQSIEQIEAINAKVRANMDKEKALEEAKDLSDQYGQMSAELEKVRSEKMGLLSSANLPLPDLSVQNGELIYKGKSWDCMSGSEQLRVAVAIVRAINPECRFVLLDKTEQMDVDTLNAFGSWLEGEGLQAICTRVGTGEECEIIIEDGMVARKPSKQWKEGEF